MKELGIKMITAHSAQAKGRIERVFGTLQERLVWEMRLRGISTPKEGNEYLPIFFKEYNNKFGKEPANAFNAHRPLNQNRPLKYILSWKERRVVSKNLEINYENKIFQIQIDNKHKKNLNGVKVDVITTLDGELLFEHQGVKLRVKPFENPLSS